MCRETSPACAEALGIVARASGERLETSPDPRQDVAKRSLSHKLRSRSSGGAIILVAKRSLDLRRRPKSSPGREPRVKNRTLFGLTRRDSSLGMLAQAPC